MQTARGLSRGLVSFALMCAVLWLGLAGPRDPLSNLLPLTFWTLGWVLVVSLSGVLGNLWAWLNPWTGLLHLLNMRPLLTWPERIGYGPAAVLLLVFSGFLLADIAPDNPARLARFLAAYWLAFFGLGLLFGEAALRRAELGHAVIGAYARLAALRRTAPGGIGAPGWQIVRTAPHAGAGAFALVLLGSGSFDGVNETFWWLATIGVNPLEFPGRSAIVRPTLTGLFLANVALFLATAACVWIGLRFARTAQPFGRAFNWLALSLLPIALAYHVAHYLPSFLVSIQYTLAALTDPFAIGADYLGLGDFRVTTGFFNRLDTVRVIWLTQAGAVVLGHVWSVLLAHGIADRLLAGQGGAWRLTAPLSAFMIAYTFLGLWLLAAPKGA